ncbi:hypothetical protein GCK72_001626 [Caenorhabditis remanei]|uniref:Serpin domain-containing protein n=2 Tax=Caenorhabditis remanei TaxID=31234 RepID=E3LNA1_CAERE|nr:hypothetical protein GCK72_001626 [Caenorhabditis remanei]EFP03108.1 hypothetical protein CRE_28617 [Caenorhabditis remanei]KAF1769809.1 hypothetical protein GCK72_001626 [Caenorhabditis remanei]
MESQFSEIITTVGLNFLKKIGVHQSVVFSSVLVFSSLTNYSIDFNTPLPPDLIDGSPAFKMSEVMEQLEELTSSLEKENVTSPIWRYPFSVNQLKQFHLSESNSKPMRFISMNKKQNWQISCDQEENKWTEDDIFRVLGIPMCEKSMSFVMFMPKHHEPLRKSLKKLDTSRFKTLVQELAPGYVHFKIPVFKISSNIPTSRILGLRRPFHHRLKFRLTSQNVRSIDDCKVTTRSPRGMIKKPCETIPFHFDANRPFLFAIMNGATPLTMGVFSGNEN